MRTGYLKSQIFIGVVEDNQDPKKLGRCRCRVLNLFDDLETDSLPWASPWKDLNGNQFIVPEKGKVVTIVFDEGNIYKPEYIYAEHYNINLEKKLSELSGDNYTSMRALLFDHKTQIYSNDEEGLKIDYKFNNINITETSINLNLKDNFSDVNIGSNNADQQAILGNNFLNWFDKFITTLCTNGLLGNLASPLIATPSLLRIKEEYFTLRDPKFLSYHVNIVDNDHVNVQERIADPQIGDKWKSTVSSNQVKTESADFKPQKGSATDTPTPKNGDLTVSNDAEGKANPTVVAKEANKIDNPTSNKDALEIIETMKAKGYTIYSKPYEMNIVSIRRQYEGTAYTNKFVDSLYLIFKIDDTDKWESKKYSISTMPGYYRAVEIERTDGLHVLPAENGCKLQSGEKWGPSTPDGKPVEIKSTSLIKKRGGLSILKPGQYIDVFTIGTHLDVDAMVTIGAQRAYKDNSESNVIKFTSEVEGSLNLFIHLGYPGGIDVNNWSEGTQVFSTENDLKDFFKWCKMHKEKHGNKFSNTLIEERDLGKKPAITPTQTPTPQPAQQTQVPLAPPPPEPPANLVISGTIGDGGDPVVVVKNNGVVIQTQTFVKINYTLEKAIEQVKFMLDNFGISGDDGRFYKQGEVPR
jgi:hypothetical protein